MPLALAISPSAAAINLGSFSSNAASTSDLPILRSRRATDAYIALGAAAFLLAAHLLTPDPSGFGTHRQLIPIPCIFLLVTHIPCPGCGLTTSVTWTAHGRLDLAFHSHYLGPFLYFAGWIILIWSILAAALGFPSATHLFRRRSFLVALLILYLGAWIVRLSLLFLARS